jgi:signal transduction histidine kinase
MMSGEAGSVLVVDDTVENLRLLSDLLTGHGYEVRAVTSGRQALQAMEHDLPDLILLDVTMPDMDGFEVCRQLGSNERSKDVPVIFLTALNETADKVRAFNTGGVDYVTKPFQFDELLARVRTHSSLRRAQVALADSYDRLRRLERLREDLVQMIVHDMRSPLAALQIHLDMLKGAASALSGNSREDVEAATRLAKRLNRMAEDLLDVSRLEAGKMPIKPVLCDLAHMAREVCSALRTIDRERPIDVESAGDAQVMCDGTLIRRALENLISNGITHTPAGSRLRVRIASAGSRVRVAVHDEGDGVPPEARDKIFEKFGTVDGQHGRTSRSVGLGLAFCKLAIEAQGGTIGVDPGVPTGSTFWFELPA